ncbi:MAG: DUF1566 domain-containing protein [Prevotella sp.]|nr:DUF1566 domain-containing protein [Prevotella sp.]
MARKTKAQAVQFDIINGNFDDYDGYDIEVSLQRKLQELNEKGGYNRWVQKETYYYLQGFASKAAARTYDSDPETNAALLLYEEMLPISTTQSDSYVARLATSRSSSTTYTVKDGDDFEVALRFCAVHIIAALNQQENVGGSGTLIIERSTDGQNFTRVGTAVVESQDATANNYPSVVNVGQYLLSGATNIIRLRAQFDYTDEQGNAGVRASSNIVLTIQSVSLALSCTAQWESPIMAQGRTDFPLTYNVIGAVAKTLHISVSGSSRDLEDYTIPLSASEQGSREVRIPEQSIYGLLSHGIHTVTAWLTADDGQGGTLRTANLINRFMVVNTSTEGADVMAPRLLIQEMSETVQNFVQSTLCGYAVYSPSIDNENNIVNNGHALNLTFLLTGSNQDIMTVQQTEYASLPQVASPGTKYELGVTVEIEQNVGESAADTLDAFLHVKRVLNGVESDFLAASTGVGFMYVSVDNTGGFQPVAGSTFLLNPKTRNNGEANPMRILNARNNNAVVESIWTGFKLDKDGWVTDEQGNKVLRVPAGCLLNIKFNPFSQFRTSRASSMTLDLDVAMRNVTNEDDAIIQICELVDGLVRGLRLAPMVGTMTTESKKALAEADFRWQEDERTHISVNCVSAVTPNVNGDGLHNGTRGNANGSMPLVRIFINGVICRELQFSTESFDEFCTGSMSNGGIILGQSGADLDVYGIRCWQDKAITSAEVVQNYVSTLPDSEEKRRVKRENDIIDPATNQVSVDKIKALGKNVLIWHGNEPYHDNVLKDETGWIEIYRFDANGNYLPELSGTICKATRSVPQKRQGTTANTYYYSNIQFKIDKIKATITVLLSSLHSSISATWDASYVWKDGDGNPTGETGAWMLKGGNMGKNFPLPSESAVAYHAATIDGQQAVIVPDGWIDGNGKYRGQGYKVADGWTDGNGTFRSLPMAQKLVNKINYASSMQSHLIGVNWLYNVLHTTICGNSTIQNAVNGAVVAKHTEPFVFFVQGENDAKPVFRGPCAFGPGKMDKPTWGYVKLAHPLFTMIEGADNDKPLTDMRVPFDDEVHGSDARAKVEYSPDDEAWIYHAKTGDEKSINFDAGATDEIDGKEYPKANITAKIKAAWNFLYLHAPRIRFYSGSFAEFLNSSEAEHTENKYWCRSASGNSTGDYQLKRYDFADGEWVDAGLWNGVSYDVIDLRTYSMTKASWDAMSASERASLDVANKKFIDAIIADCRANIGNYFKVDSLKFHYCFENHFIAGTDNCSKNTYYVLDPEMGLFELHQDDVDTVLATDNSGLQSKPYYLDRMHPYGGNNASVVAMTGDVDNNSILYEGYYNVLFDLVELMWENTGELQTMMRRILGAMSSLNGTKPGSEASKNLSGVWGTLNKYIFDIQRYFPQMVYNEAARIRYEFPTLLGYKSDNREVVPITQSMGDQLQAELQFMKRRLVYMASYAAFGEFRNMNDRSAGLTNAPDALDAFSMMHKALPGTGQPSVYRFNLVPHQWIYPVGGVDNDTRDPHVRVAPGETYQLTITPSNASDNGVSVYGLNFYRSLGNVGDMVTNDASEFTLNGKRLTEFVAEPTQFYTSENLPAFRVSGFAIGSATRLRKLSLKGAVLGGGTINLSSLSLAREIDLRQTDIAVPRLPQTSTLETVQLPATVTSLTLENMPSLETVTMEGYNAIQELTIGDNMTFNSGALVKSIFNSSGKVLRRLTAKGISWTNVAAAMVTWMMTLQSCTLTGNMALVSTDDLPYSDVIKLIDNFGNIQSQNNSLYVDYKKNSINSFVVKGVKYIKNVGTWSGWDIVVAPTRGNAVGIINGHENVEWTLSGDNISEYAEVVDAVKGIIRVKQVQVTEHPLRFTLTVKITMVDGTYLTYTKGVGFANRIPRVGDFAYSDGTFDDEYDLSKKLVGTVIKRDVNAWYDSAHTIPSDCKLWIYAKENAVVKSTDSSLNTSSLPWGIYPDESGANGFPASFYNTVATKAGLENAVDTRMANLTSSGLTSPTDATNKDYRYVRDTFLDANQDDGYAVLTGGSCNDFDIENKNDIVIKHAKAIISEYLENEYPKTTVELADQMQALVAAMTADGVSAPGRYRQLYYPAAYACYLYEPTLDEDDELNDQYKRSKWMLPTEGFLARIYNFFYNSCGRVTYENGGRCTAANANENPQSEALLPLFANLLARIAAAEAPGTPFAIPTNSYYWSVTESGSSLAWGVYFNNGNVYINNKYNSNVVRPVAAFNFTL